MENKIEKPDVKTGEWIHIGNSIIPVSAVVCNIYEGRQSGADLEVVYMDGSKAINDDIIWDDGYWRFKNSGASGGYADNSDRLSVFVNILRAGRRC